MPANRFVMTLLFSDRPRTLPALLRGPFSQIELAEKIKADATTINDWEQGRAFPQPRFVRALIEHANAWAPTLGIRLIDVLDPDLFPKTEKSK